MQPKENPIASNIKISEGVLETIVKTVISEIPGVARLTTRSSCRLTGCLTVRPHTGW